MLVLHSQVGLAALELGYGLKKALSINYRLDQPSRPSTTVSINL